MINIGFIASKLHHLKNHYLKKDAKYF